MHINVLNQLDFDLVYLAMLTQERIKPLSRWEASWDPRTEALLEEMGLLHHRIRRRARNGRRVEELVFSRSARLIQDYATLFDETLLSGAPDATRQEGLLFGYPACCGERFLTQGYAANGLSRRDQRILFHWACPECRVTPGLLDAYREIHRRCRKARGDRGRDFRVGAYAEALHQRAAEVASWAAMLAVAGGLSMAASGVAQTNLAHLLPTVGDFDEDGLKDVEEWFFNTQTNLPDTDANGLLDGYDVARRLWLQAGALSRTPQTHAPYASEYLAKGTVRCEVCGAIVNMGFLQVVNPVESTEVAVPFLALHFMEHGGLVYQSDDLYFDDRVDPCRTDIVINNHPPPRLTAGHGVFTLHWHGLGDKTYQMDTAVDLNTPWTPGATYAGNDAALEHIDAAPDPAKRFYRLSWE